MKAIILAAGYGNRMRPLTDSRHKTLLEVGGKTILSRIIDALRDNGIEDIVLVTGYRAEELIDYAKSHYPDLAFTFVHNDRYRETNNIFSMALAFESINIDSDIILIESDLIFDPQVLQRLVRSPYPTVALVDKYRSGMDGTVVAVNNGIITSVIPSHAQGESFDFSDKYKTLNIYKFSREFCETSFRKLLTYYARTINDNCYYELILGMLIYMQQETIHAEILDGEKWAEVDDPNDLRVADFVFNANRGKLLDDAFGGYWNFDVIDFAFIRNMHFPPTALISEMKNNLPDLIHNYGSRQTHLDQKMAWFLLCAAGNIVALNGASQAYPVLAQMFAGKRALIPSPTFGEYNRIFPHAERYADEVGIDVDALARQAPGFDVVVIVNPNNPTGSVVPSAWILKLAHSMPAQTFIVDESFIEFSSEPSLMHLLEKEPCDNIIIIKSLSKSLGMPGIRLGYAYSSNPESAKKIRGALPIWNMNSLAEFALETMLKHRRSLQQSFDLTKRDRTAFMEQLAAAPAVEKVYPSGANFLLVALRPPLRAADVVQLLLIRHSIYAKDISAKFASGRQYLRLAVRNANENALLAGCLRSILPEH